MKLFRILLMLPFLLGIVLPCVAQTDGEDNLQRQGTRYLDLRISSLTRLTQRTARQQSRLMRRLVHREQRFANQLRKRDSAAYTASQRQGVSFDSLSKLDSPTVIRMAGRMRHTADRSIDSLRAVASFVSTTTGGALQQAGPYTDKLDGLSNDRQYSDALNELIGKRSNQLSGLTDGKSNVPALTGIQKDIFYTRGRIAAWKKVADDPDAAEEKALEYLQGTPGFDEAMLRQSAQPDAGGSGGNKGGLQMAASGATAADLEKMGLQTKRQVGAGLQQRFGANTSTVQQQLAGQVGDWQQKVTGAATAVKDARAGINGLQNSLRKDATGFKVNPMRGLPFWKRLEKSYSFQAQRASSERPALLQLGGNIGFRHTPKLSYGLGAVMETGLGSDWRHVRFTIEGVGLRSYAAWQIGWGFGAYAGYQRVWGLRTIASKIFPDNRQLKNLQKIQGQGAILIGITKSYRVSSSYRGCLQALYDVKWRDKGLQSPFIIRITTQLN